MRANNLPPDDEPEEEKPATFGDFVKGVRQIKSDTVERSVPIMDPEVSRIIRDIYTDEHKEEEPDFFSTANMEFVDPNDTISYKVPGLQYGVARKLKAGEYLPRMGADLHNSTIEQAYKKVRKLIVRAHRENVRCVLIVHGKGEYSKPKALLKSYVAHWLKMMPEVLAYHTAMPYHGDKGATYVLIRKGEEERTETREIHAKRT